MPRRTRVKVPSKKHPKPNDKAWEREMMDKLRKDAPSSSNPEDDSEFEHPFGYEHGSYGDMFDYLE